MNYTLKSAEGLIILSHLTRYNIGEIYRLVEHYGDIELDEFLSKYGRNAHELDRVAKQTFNEVVKEAINSLYKLDYYNIKTETFFSDKYPAKLKKIKDPPPVIYYRGNLRRNKLVAIVGTREPTHMADKVIPLLVEVFKKNDYGIVSGLALGIDSIAHRAAIEQRAYTVAIMPNSLDTIYPKENYSLANQILQNKDKDNKAGGALISELAIGISHGKRSFVQRNRIQAGISDYVVPVEMGIKSGTMTTVEFAYAQGKYILIFPPKENYRNTPQYEGINYFMDKATTEKYRKTYIIRDLKELDQFLNTSQESLF